LKLLIRLALPLSSTHSGFSFSPFDFSLQPSSDVLGLHFVATVLTSGLQFRIVRIISIKNIIFKRLLALALSYLR
jgi:hypothetical protein